MLKLATAYARSYIGTNRNTVNKERLTEMGISNTTDVNAQAQEEAHLHHHQCQEDCNDEKGLGHTILPFFAEAQRGVLRLLQPELAEFDTTPWKEEATKETTTSTRNSQQQQGGDQSSSSPTTMAEEPSEVSSITSTSKPYRSVPPWIRRRQLKMHVPTMIVVRVNGGATLDSGSSTNDAQLLEDSNDTSSTSTSTAAETIATFVSNAIVSTFSSWIQPNSEIPSNNDDDTSTSSSSNAALSSFSSWVRPDSPMLSSDADAAVKNETSESAESPREGV